MPRKQKEKIGYLGATTQLGPDQTTFGFMAATRYFASQKAKVEFVNLPDHDSICQAVAHDKLRFGVVAIENVIDGVVNEVIRSVEELSELPGIHVCGEVAVPVEIFYLGKGHNGQLPKKVLSHPKALAQCSRFRRSLAEKGIEIVASASTGIAAYEASLNEELACLASSKAAEDYGLHSLAGTGNVVDYRNNNMTRFWVLSKTHGAKTGRDKSSFLVNLAQNEVGALYRTLGCFANQGCNLLLIYPISVPGRCWEYTFFMEFQGHLEDPQIQKAWRDLRESGLTLNSSFLGSYPADTTNIA